MWPTRWSGDHGPMSTITVSAPDRLVAATPARRDRYVDFLRVASLAVVMLGHWLMAAVEWHDGGLRAANVLEAAPGLQWLTWAFQIMPVFFFVGGFSNTASWTAAQRDGAGYGAWLAGRLTRLVRPVLVFAVVWSAVVAGVRLAGGDPAAMRAGSIAQPLWFLAVYVAAVAVAPGMVAAHRRWALAVPGALAAAVVTVDLARWPLGVPVVGWANLALVWLFVHQLGVAWRSGAVAAWPRRRLLVLAAAALGAMVVLTTGGGYPRSMVGGMEARSNTFPPSLALLALAVWQFGMVLAVRGPVDRWLGRPRAWAAVVGANRVAMTVYLWHLTAMVIVAAVVLPRGWMPQPPVGSAVWWAWRPIWVLALAAALVPLVAMFAQVELARVAPGPLSPVRAGLAAAAVAAGMAVLAKRGFVAPGVGLGLVAAGWALLRAGARAWSPASS